MKLGKRLGAGPFEDLHEDRIRVRQGHHEAGNRTQLSPLSDHRKADIHLGFARRMHQGQEYLLPPLAQLMHRRLHLGVAAGIPFFTEARADQTVQVLVDTASTVPEGAGEADNTYTLPPFAVLQPGGGVVAPKVASASYVESTYVDVTFDKPTGFSAGDKQHYAISPQEAVNTASLDAKGATVQLATNSQDEAKACTVTVTGMRGAAGVNLDAAHNEVHPFLRTVVAA